MLVNTYLQLLGVFVIRLMELVLLVVVVFILILVFFLLSAFLALACCCVSWRLVSKCTIV